MPREKDQYSQHQPDSWEGTQLSDQYSYDRNTKPIYPDCDRSTQHQFAESLPNPEFRGQENYVQATFDSDNQVIPVQRQFDHDAGAIGDQGRFGDRMFADTDQAGTADSMNGYNVIEYGGGARFNRAQSTAVSNDRADRGAES